MAINYVILGEKIREARSARRISQSRLADLIDRSPTFISCLERGEKGPSLDTLVQIADSLRTSLDTLLESNRTPLLPDRMPGIKTEFPACSAYEQFVLYRIMTDVLKTLREGETLHDPCHECSRLCSKRKQPPG